MTTTAQLATYLVNLARFAPSADNSQPIDFQWDGNKISASYASDRVAGETFLPQDPATLLCVGGTLEILTRSAEQLQADYSVEQSDTKAIEESQEDESSCYFSITLNSNQNTPLPPPKEPLRHTNRFAYHTKALPETIIQYLTESHEGESRIQVLTAQEEIISAHQLVKGATEIRFQTKEVHEWLGKCLRFGNVKKTDGLDVMTLDLPPGGQLLLKFISDWSRMQLLNRLKFYKLLSTIDSAPIKKAPAIVAITGEDSITGAIEAGTLLERSWTYLNQQKLAVHPYYVIPDLITRQANNSVPSHLCSQAEQIVSTADQLFDTQGNRRLYMLLRVGYPKNTTPVRSARLPMEHVFKDISAG